MLESEPDADVGGDADVGMAEGLLDADECHALLKLQGRKRMPQIMKADVPDLAASQRAFRYSARGTG